MNLQLTISMRHAKTVKYKIKNCFEVKSAPLRVAVSIFQIGFQTTVSITGGYYNERLLPPQEKVMPRSLKKS
ncbi:MAG: hypothetical protein WC208_09850 [Gallionella sp.]